MTKRRCLRVAGKNPMFKPAKRGQGLEHNIGFFNSSTPQTANIILAYSQVTLSSRDSAMHVLDLEPQGVGRTPDCGRGM